MTKAIALLMPVYVTLIWSLILLFQKKSSGKKAISILVIFMLTAFLLYTSHAIFFNDLYHLYSFVDSIYQLAVLSLYPMFFAYILTLSGKHFKQRWYLLNFIPAVVFSTTILFLNLLLSPDERIFCVKEVFINQRFTLQPESSVLNWRCLLSSVSRLLFILQSVIYLLLGIRLVNKQIKIIPNFYSNIEGRSLAWVRNLSIFMLFVSFLGISLAIIGRSYFTHHELILLIPSVLFSIIFFLIGFYGSQQLPISEDVADPEFETDRAVESYSAVQMETLKSKLLQLFEKEQIYIHPDLRITTIAEQLGTNRTYISRLINEEFSMNFNEFVNQYRIMKAEELLACTNLNVYTLEYIAEQCGFGNTNSFTRVFKEVNAITPGQYRLNCQKDTRK